MGLFSKKKLTLSEHWEIYFTNLDGFVTAMRVDVDAMKNKQFLSLKHTYILRVRYSEQYENGFPLPESLQYLNGIEDLLDKKLSTEPLYLVGVITQNGYRDFVFQSTKKLDWDKLIDKTFASGPEVILQKVVVLDDNGAYYRDYLYPTKYDFNWIENAKVCRSLAAGGEVFVSPRKINYFAYFPSEDRADEFVKKLQGFEYNFSEMVITQNDANIYQVAFVNVDIPEQENMTGITNKLLDLAEELNGSFDGWGTTIEKE